jgi:hypothetical protein
MASSASEVKASIQALVVVGQFLTRPSDDAKQLRAMAHDPEFLGNIS